MVVGLLLWLTTPVAALSIPCQPAEDGTIILDGMLRDWKGVTAVPVRGAAHVVSGRKHWDGDKDSSFEVLCNYSKGTLYLAFDVADEYFMRSRKRRGDDHLTLRFGRKTLSVYPGDLKKIRGAVYWGRRKARGIQMAEAMQLRGWSVELAIPFSRIPGYRKGQSAIPVTFSHVDGDWRGKTDSVVSTGPSKLVVAQVVADLQAFLKDMQATMKDVRFRRSADVVGDKGLEQVLAVRRRIGIVGSGVPNGGYFYFRLPVQKAADIHWLKLLDLDGDRQKEIIVRYTQRGGGGERTIVAVYRFDSVNKFVRPFAQEVRKAQGTRSIENRLTFRKRRRRGYDIVVDKPKARGFTVENFREQPASDLNEIILPWAAKKKRAYRFEGDQYSEL